jgi:hypothetical protein
MSAKSTALTESATLTANLLEAYTLGANWAEAPAGTFTHTTGSTATITNAYTIVTATKYQLTFTISGNTAGTVTVGYGGISQASTAGSNTTYSFGGTTASTTAFTITPTSTFDGAISNISLQIISDGVPTFRIVDNTNATTFAIRSSLASLNNTFVGSMAGYSNTTGYSNTFNGTQAGRSNTTGYYNTFNGYAAGYSNTTGYYNMFNGYAAGRYLLDGITVNATSNNSDFHGNDTRSFAATQSYEVVIGSTVKGNGSNTVTLGGGNNTATRWTLSYNNTNTQAGSNLTIQAQSAFTGGTAKLAGGMLTINPGASKDWAFSSVRIGGNTRGAASAELNTIVDKFVVPSSRILTNNTDSTIFTCTILAADTVLYGNTVSGNIHYQVSVKGTNGYQTESGEITFNAVRYDGTVTSGIGIDHEREALSSSTLVVAPTISYLSGVWTVKVNVNSGLDTPVIRFDYIVNKGASAPTLTQF